MASIRKRGSKWQVLIRRNGINTSKVFTRKQDAKAWAREMEVKAEQQDITVHRSRELDDITLGELVTRYRDTITPRKRGREAEHIVLSTFLRHPIARKRLSKITPADFSAYCEQRLLRVKPATLRRQLNPIRHMFEIARREWNIPIVSNPIDDIIAQRPDILKP